MHDGVDVKAPPAPGNVGFPVAEFYLALRW